MNISEIAAQYKAGTMEYRSMDEVLGVPVNCDCGNIHIASCEDGTLSWKCPVTGEIFCEVDA